MGQEGLGNTIPTGLGEWVARRREDLNRAAHDANRIKGPISALCMHLHQIGWSMLAHDVLVDERGVEYNLTEVAPRWVQQRVREAARDKEWGRSAETRRDMQGGAEGVEVGHALRVIRDTKNVDPDKGALQEAIFRGGLWFHMTGRPA